MDAQTWAQVEQSLVTAMGRCRTGGFVVLEPPQGGEVGEGGETGGVRGPGRPAAFAQVLRVETGWVAEVHPADPVQRDDAVDRYLGERGWSPPERRGLLRRRSSYPADWLLRFTEVGQEALVARAMAEALRALGVTPGTGWNLQVEPDG
ncbi:TY-Chap domain-containing protein [Kytococcus sp. Marseille-QA3725]